MGMRPPLGRRAALLAVALAALTAVACDSGREAVLRHFHVGYQGEVMDLVKAGHAAEALDLLERGSFLDETHVALLERMDRLNQDAKVYSQPVAWFSRARSGDAALRFAIGRALMARLGGGRRPTETQRRLLERATANARTLVALEPDSARSHFLLGMTHLLRGRSTGAPGDYARAASELQTALASDPAYPGARRALDEARGHAAAGT
jgi:tetratricopeptide (TPR) repeat protein